MQELKTATITRLRNAIYKASDLDAIRSEIIAFLDTLIRARKMEQNATEKLSKSLGQKI